MKKFNNLKNKITLSIFSLVVLLNLKINNVYATWNQGGYLDGSVSENQEKDYINKENQAMGLIVTIVTIVLTIAFIKVTFDFIYNIIKYGTAKGEEAAKYKSLAMSRLPILASLGAVSVFGWTLAIAVFKMFRIM